MAAKWEARAAEPFEDPTRLTNWVTWTQCTLAVMCLIGIAVGFMERDMLLDILADKFASDEELQEAKEASDLRVGLQLLVQIAVFLIAAILSLKWIYRANLNARRLGAKELRFSPGFAAGCNFIPFVNLWLPYRAMQEIWRASTNPEHWQAQKTPVLFPIWWSLWIVWSLVSQIGYRVGENAKEMPALLAANGLIIASNVLEIALVAAFLAIIRQIYRLQIQRSAAGQVPTTEQPVTVPS